MVVFALWFPASRLATEAGLSVLELSIQKVNLPRDQTKWGFRVMGVTLCSHTR